jgi:NAD(P)H dehydrogenase (quinone)
MLPIYVGNNVFESGIYLPSGDGKLPFALRREMGEAIANVIVQSDEHQNKTFNITNNELYSFDDVAKILSALSGKTISYKSADANKFTEIRF